MNVIIYEEFGSMLTIKKTRRSVKRRKSVGGRVVSTQHVLVRLHMRKKYLWMRAEHKHPKIICHVVLIMTCLVCKHEGMFIN